MNRTPLHYLKVLLYDLKLESLACIYLHTLTHISVALLACHFFERNGMDKKCMGYKEDEMG